MQAISQYTLEEIYESQTKTAIILPDGETWMGVTAKDPAYIVHRDGEILRFPQTYCIQRSKPSLQWLAKRYDEWIWITDKAFATQFTDPIELTAILRRVLLSGTDCYVVKGE